MKKFIFEFPVSSDTGLSGRAFQVIRVSADNLQDANEKAWAEARADEAASGDMILGNPEIFRDDEMPRLHPFRVQTLQQPAEGTVYSIICRYLPGRNVVIATATDLGGKREIAATFQVNDFLRFWAQADVTGTAQRGEAAIELLERADAVISTIYDDR